MLSVNMLSVVMLRVTNKAPNAECHYDECRYAECRGAKNGHFACVRSTVVEHSSLHPKAKGSRPPPPLASVANIIKLFWHNFSHYWRIASDFDCSYFDSDVITSKKVL
jgi:hypothetical protein